MSVSNVPDIVQKQEDRSQINIREWNETFPLSHVLMFRSAPPLFISVFNFLILGQLALCCSVLQLYPVQESVWYLYQLRSRRSKQQRAEDNTSPGINNLQGNGPGSAGSCFKILKTGEVPHVKNRKCRPVESASLHTVPIPALNFLSGGSTPTFPLPVFEDTAAEPTGAWL